MDKNTEILFDIYLSVEVYFSSNALQRDATLNANLTRIKSLYSCFDVQLKQQNITLYDDHKQDTRFPERQYYYLSALFSFDGLSPHALHILERAFNEIINVWNHRLWGYELDYARCEVNTYAAGQRP